jgi:hypothetical protein
MALRGSVVWPYGESIGHDAIQARSRQKSTVAGAGHDTPVAVAAIRMAGRILLPVRDDIAVLP